MNMRMGLFVFLLAVAGEGWCGLTVTAEGVGVQSSTVAGAVVYNFNGLAPALSSNVTANFGSVTGTYDRLWIRTADQYGGANISNYPVAAVAYGVQSYTLTLSNPVNYIGLWWSAGDASNQLDFYLGATRIATFSTATALGVLPATYRGNPNGVNQDPGEYFAYLNFFGTAGTTFDRVVFTVTNNTGGFESDNHAIATNAVPNGGLQITTITTDTPAATVPTISAWAAILLAVLVCASGVVFLRSRRPS